MQAIKQQITSLHLQIQIIKHTSLYPHVGSGDANASPHVYALMTQATKRPLLYSILGSCCTSVFVLDACSALYQLHLVKAETARAFVPRELRLVEAFGYTLGGLFLVQYDGSPAGRFDELVIIAGIVWNPPTSCAWAARVLVSSREACRHGRKEIGLPSRVATFSKAEAAPGKKPLLRSRSFLSMLGMGSTVTDQEDDHEIEISEIQASCRRLMCKISRPFTAKSDMRDKWMSPVIKMSLPSFSGQTEDRTELLKYSCQIECRVRPVKPAKIWAPRTSSSDGKNSAPTNTYANVLPEEDSQRQSIQVLLSRPILALEFSSLRMHVDAPEVFVPLAKKNQVRYSST